VQRSISTHGTTSKIQETGIYAALGDLALISDLISHQFMINLQQDAS
jgi:hypothetical protein